jgi:hypothetical protein
MADHITTIAVYAVHNFQANQQPMAFPTYENAEAYAKAEGFETYEIIPIAVVRYESTLHPVSILVRPSGGTIEEGSVPEAEPLPDGEADGAVPCEGTVQDAL